MKLEDEKKAIVQKNLIENPVVSFALKSYPTVKSTDSEGIDTDAQQKKEFEEKRNSLVQVNPLSSTTSI